MTLTAEQEQALNELVRLIPSKNGVGASPPDASTDWLKTWLGASQADLSSALKSLLAQKDGVEQRVLDWLNANPIDATIEALGAASWAFYLAEKDDNPKIKTYVDAFYYITTCASVGYADIFAVTQTGRLIASLVMTFGPALTNKTLDRPLRRLG